MLFKAFVKSAHGKGHVGADPKAGIQGGVWARERTWLRSAWRGPESLGLAEPSMEERAGEAEWEGPAEPPEEQGGG